MRKILALFFGSLAILIIVAILTPFVFLTLAVVGITSLIIEVREDKISMTKVLHDIEDSIGWKD